MIEKIIFNVVAIALFTIIFLKLIRKNDTSYIIILAIELIGMIINFIELFIAKRLPIFGIIIMYLFSIVIPLLLIWMEKFKNINFSELYCLAMTAILEKLDKHDEAKDMIINYLNKNKNSYRINKLLANVYEKEENYEAAISAYRKVLDLNRKDIENY